MVAVRLDSCALRSGRLGVASSEAELREGQPLPTSLKIAGGHDASTDFVSSADNCNNENALTFCIYRLVLPRAPPTSAASEGKAAASSDANDQSSRKSKAHVG